VQSGHVDRRDDTRAPEAGLELDLDLTAATPFQQNANSCARLSPVRLSGPPHASDVSLRVYAADDWLVSEPVSPV